MVTTRSGIKFRQHGVRFKRGATVRRILDYDDSYDFEVNSGDLTAHTEVSPLRGILTSPKEHSNSNGHLQRGSAEQLLNNKTNGLTQPSMDKTDYDIRDDSILYDLHNTERHFTSSVLVDTLLFILFATLATYTFYFTQSLLGYRIYTVLVTLFISMFTYNIAYFDSAMPGVMPPSPISPAKYRHISGHSYHLTYIMCIINAITFLLADYLLQDIVVPAL